MGVSKVESRISHRLTPFDGDGEVDIGRRDPGHVDAELLAGQAAVEPGQQAERQDERRQGDRESPDAAAMRRGARDRQRREESGERQEQDDQQEVHRRPPAMPSATISTTEPNSTQVA